MKDINERRRDIKPSTFEVVSRILGPEVAYSLRQHLREASQCDEESYAYKDALMTYVNMEAAVKCEECVDNIKEEYGKIREGQTQFLENLNALAKASFLQKNVCRGEVKQRLSVSVPNIDSSNWLFSFVCKCGHLVALRPRLALGAWCISLAALFAIDSYSFGSWRSSERATNQRVREAAYEQANAWASDQVDQRFQNLKPASYKLAQLFEQRARYLQSPTRETFWQVCLSEDDGITDVDTKLEVGSPIMWLIKMPYEPDRLTLDKTSPSPAPPATKRNDATVTKKR